MLTKETTKRQNVTVIVYDFYNNNNNNNNNNNEAMTLDISNMYYVKLYSSE